MSVESVQKKAIHDLANALAILQVNVPLLKEYINEDPEAVAIYQDLVAVTHRMIEIFRKLQQPNR